MTDKAFRLNWGTTEDGQLDQALARSQTAPDYTMGALAQQTDVPPDTLRSWERRYGFPDPVRTDTNRRLYSERDIVAVRWLRDQTEHGQGISEAIAMLLSRIPDQAHPAGTSPHIEAPPPPQRDATPIDRLLNELRNGELAEAQATWDDLVVALSADGIGNAILTLDRQLPEGTTTTTHARAFLLRKAMLLLDRADPDRGHSAIVPVTADTSRDTLPATVLAAALARASYRVISPFPDMTSLAAVDAIHHLQPEAVVLVGASQTQAETFERLIPGSAIHRWSSGEEADSVPRLIDRMQRLRQNR